MYNNDNSFKNPAESLTNPGLDVTSVRETIVLIDNSLMEDSNAFNNTLQILNDHGISVANCSFSSLSKLVFCSDLARFLDSYFSQGKSSGDFIQLINSGNFPNMYYKEFLKTQSYGGR